MNQRSRLLLMLVLLLAACTPAPDPYTELEHQVIDTGNAQLILLQVDNGEVTILRSESRFLELDGRVLSPDEFASQVSTTEEQITVTISTRDNRAKTPPLHLVVRLPPQVQASIETDRASIKIQDYDGNLKVISTSGNITAERVAGVLSMRSNRGAITVRHGSGEVNAVGNYGPLTFQDTSGKTAASTIMGDILFEGLIQGGDAVRLETDHGAVSVNLRSASALTLQIRSATGGVICMLPGIDSTTRTCDGVIASGGGTLSVRTVSGAVTLQLLP